MITLVGNDKCAPCLKAKQLLIDSGVEWQEKDRWDDDIRELFKRHQVRSIPALFVGDQYIGGYQQLDDYLSKM